MRNKGFILEIINKKISKINGNEILKNSFNTEQIWKMVREKAKGRPRFSKNNFWIAVRNPIYCGKIFIPAFKDEEAHFVRGLHEPIISEMKFREIQDILDGRTRSRIKPKIITQDNFPLRGFLKCPKCENMLTASSSRGKMGKYYHYYHCNSKCGIRFKAADVNGKLTFPKNNQKPRLKVPDLRNPEQKKILNLKNKALPWGNPPEVLKS